MAYIVAENGIKCHWNFWLLAKGFEAITLFGHVFYRKDKSYVQNVLLTYRGKITMNHEHIHVLQANTFKTKYFGFYMYYLWYWFIGLFKFGVKNNASYYNIPFEIEAYRHQENFNYNESHWKDYRYTHKNS